MQLTISQVRSLTLTNIAMRRCTNGEHSYTKKATSAAFGEVGIDMHRRDRDNRIRIIIHGYADPSH